MHPSMTSLLTLQVPFVADHFHDLPGFVEARHGHNWVAEIMVEGSETDAPEASLHQWIQQVDYTLLNDLPALAGRNPTAEVLAEWLFRHLDEAGLHPVRVRIREKAQYWAACQREVGS